MQARDLDHVAWVGSGALRRKVVASGVDLFSVTEAADLPDAEAPCILLVLGGDGALVAASATVLVEPGITIHVSEPGDIRVLPSGDRAIVLLRFPHEGWSDETASPVISAERPPSEEEATSPPEHHVPEAPLGSLGDGSPGAQFAPAPDSPPTAPPSGGQSASPVRPPMPRLIRVHPKIRDHSGDQVT